MQVRPTTTTRDSDDRVLVIARLTDADTGDVLGAAKMLIRDGADLILLPEGQIEEAFTEELCRRGQSWAVSVSTEGDAKRVRRLGATLIHRVVSDTPPSTGRAKLGDLWALSLEALAELDQVPHGVRPVVDLGSRSDRAELAALVTVGLEAGAAGFITVAPLPVRRAAHVIRAVERAR